jgi:hypothetical protein
MRMRWQSFAYFKAEYYRRWPLPYRESRAYLEAQTAAPQETDEDRVYMKVYIARHPK